MMAKDLSAATQSLLEAKQSKGGLTTEQVAKKEKDGKWVSKAGEMQAKSTPKAARKKENPAQDDGQVQSESSARRRKTARAR